MRLNPLMYLGDSIPRRGTALLGDPAGAWNSAATEAQVVRSNIDSGDALVAPLDIAAIERQARAAQAAWFASNLNSFFAALARKFSRPGQGGRDAWPASTQSLEYSEGRTAEETDPLPRPGAKYLSGVEMKARSDKENEWASVYARLDTLPMSDYARQQAKESLRKAEFLAELVLPVEVAIRAVLHGVSHAAVSLARAVKTIFANPVRH